jgi:hypothetical protein
VTRPVHIVGWAQQVVSADSDADEVELVAPVVTEALAMAGLPRGEVGFWCSGSCDHLVGRPFSFVAAVDGLGGWPPISESHVEMDGAWALYEAWIRLQHGDVDTALVYSFGRSSFGDPSEISVQGLDPYYVAPLAPPAAALAGLQARAAGVEATAALPPGDGSAAVVLSTRASWLERRIGEPAQQGMGGPRIDGIAHLAQVHELGARDLARPQLPDVAVSDVDRAELHLLFPHEEAILRLALGLPETTPTAAEPTATTMVDGLLSFVRAAKALTTGPARSAVAHAQSGPCLQHNLLARLAAR